MITRQAGGVAVAVMLMLVGRAEAAQYGARGTAGVPGEAAEIVTPIFSIKTPYYETVMDRRGQIAELWRIDADRVRLVELTGRIGIPTGEWGPGRPSEVEMVSMTQADPRRIEVTYNMHRRDVDKKTKAVLKEEDLPEAYKLTYVFDDQEVRIHVETKPNMSMAFAPGAAAQIAENLNTGKKMGLPPIKGDEKTIGVLRSMRLTYPDGTELMYRWEGPGNPLNSSEDGGLSGQPDGRTTWSARGVETHAKYDYTFRVVPPPRPNMVVLLAPKFTVTPGAPGAIYLRGEEPSMTIAFDKTEVDRRLALLGNRPLSGTRLEYEIQDHLTNVIDKGSLPLDFGKDRDAQGRITKTVPLKPGRLGYFIARFMVRDNQNAFYALWKEEPFAVVDFPGGDAAAERARWLAPDGPFMRRDVYWRNAFIGLGLVREQFDANIFDPVRGEIKSNEVERLDKFFADRNQLSREMGVSYHVMLGGADWAKTPQDMYRFYKAVLQRYGNQCKHWETINEPNIVLKPHEYLEMYLKPLKLAAKEVSPDAVIMGPAGCGPSLDYIRELYKLGAKDYWDAVSIHPYVGGDYDIAIQEVIQGLRSIMHENGDDKKPIYFTEGGFNWWNLASQVRCARSNVRRLLIQDAYGIPKEQDMYYFTTEMGYLNFYLIYGNGTLLPQAVALRNNRVQLDGVKYAQHFDFGMDWSLGNVYTGATKQVVMVWTFDCRRPLQLKSTAAPTKVVDMWGNPVAGATFADGKITVPASGEPTYVHLPADARVQPVSIAPGRKVSDFALGADADASSAEQPVGQILDGVRYKNGWRDATPNRFPDWVEITLPYAAPLDRIMLYGSGGNRDIDVLARVDGNYVKVAEVRNNTDNLLDLAFKPVTADRVRVDILAGNGDRSALQEVEVYSSDQAGEQKYVNWALAANGGKATASSTWKIETDVPAPEANRKNPQEPVTSQRVKKTYEWSPEHAIDGVFAPSDWLGYVAATWIDGTPGQFPDWLQVDFAGDKEINVVVVFTNNFHRWNPANSGISDCDLQVWDGTGWKKAGEIRGSKKGVLCFPLQPPVKTSKIRLVVNDSNDHLHSVVMEIQAFGPAK